MLAQVTLTPTESKKLIAKAVAKLDVVQKALNEGIVVIHPSSSTYFIVEEITGTVPTTPVWVSGVVVPKGTCSHRETYRRLCEHSRVTGIPISSSPGTFPFSWVIRDGKLATGISLGSLAAEMGEKDVYIKGVNALDVEGNVGVLSGNLTKPGGTIAYVLAASKRNKFKLVFPAGLEKLIPVPIREAAKRARPRKLSYCMGMPCLLLPCKGIVVTELDAVRILSGASAVPIAAGGLGGAEGAVTLAVDGDQDLIDDAVRCINQVKGAKLPQVQQIDCASCDRPGCSLATRSLGHD